MSLKLNIKSSKAYVTAVSGLFISKEYPNGLTRKEIEVISLIMDYSVNGKITKEVKEAVIEDVYPDKQAYYNMATLLNKKKVIVNKELHKVFTIKEISLVYAKRNS